MQIYSIVDFGESDFISDLNFNNNKQQQCKLWKQLERFITHKETWRQKNMLASSMEIIHDIHTLCMVCFPSPPPTLYQEKPTHWRLHHLKFHNQTQNIHYLLLSLKHRDTQNVSTTSSSFLFKIQYSCNHHL